ncbi:TetR family transcriptional regulator C-terminal domain-containing protein [soil metagenome]
MRRASFVRESADVRRQSLIDATAQCLAERGVTGTSVRAISKLAGVSSGLLTHYFDGIDSLILATYRDLGKRVSLATDRAVEAAGSDPRARLEAFVLASFAPPVLDPKLLVTWVAFWSLVHGRSDMAQAHAEMYTQYRNDLSEHLAAVRPEKDAAGIRLAAIGIAALVDGLWLELCLDPATFTVEEAYALARRCIESHVGRN